MGAVGDIQIETKPATALRIGATPEFPLNEDQAANGDHRGQKERNRCLGELGCQDGQQHGDEDQSVGVGFDVFQLHNDSPV